MAALPTWKITNPLALHLSCVRDISVRCRLSTMGEKFRCHKRRNLEDAARKVRNLCIVLYRSRQLGHNPPGNRFFFLNRAKSPAFGVIRNVLAPANNVGRIFSLFRGPTAGIAIALATFHRENAREGSRLV